VPENGGILLIFWKTGDPYGNRTRVSAVKGEKSINSMVRPLLAKILGSIFFNGLQDRGDEFWLPDKQRKTAGKTAIFRSGAFFSCAAIFLVYRIMESAASAKSVGGAK
jgi:hypothetical protein